MNIRFLKELPEIHEVPLHKITIDNSNSIIEFDDVNENRWEIRFKTIQAWRITDTDCVDLRMYLNNNLSLNGLERNFPFIVEDSPWISDLKKALQVRNKEANYFEKSSHYVFILGEDIVEVVAWDNYILRTL